MANKTKVQKYEDDMRQEVEHAKEQLEKQREIVNQVKDKADKLDYYFIEYAKAQSKGRKIEKTVDDNEVLKAQYQIKVEKAVLHEFHEIYKEKLEELKECENQTVMEQFNKLAKKRYDINSEIESIANELASKMRTLDELDKEQRSLGSKLGIKLNHRRFSAQENVLTTYLRSYLPIVGHIPSHLRIGINDQDLMVRDAESLKMKKPQKQPS